MVMVFICLVCTHPWCTTTFVTTVHMSQVVIGCCSNRILLANVNSTFTFAICHRTSVCLSSVTLVHPTPAMFLRHSVHWPPVDIQVKFYGDRPRGTPPSGELNTRGVAEYSDFGPIERYILEMVQDRN